MKRNRPATVYAASLANAFQAASDDLDRLLTRLTRADTVLRLEHNTHPFPRTPWLVHDDANSQLMVAVGEYRQALAWMLAFQARHPEATVDMASVEAGRAVAEMLEGNEGYSVAVPRLRVVSG